MVDAQPTAEDPLQTFHHLNGEGYLGQEVEHLLLTVEGLLDEVDVYLRLSTGGDAVKQGDVLLEEGKLYLVESVLLWSAERFDVFGMRVATVIQSSHLLLVGLKEATLDKCSDRGESMALVKEFVTSNTGFRRCNKRTVPLYHLVDTGERKEIDEGFLLTGGPLQHAESDMEGLLIAEVRSETDERLRLRAIAVLRLEA